MKDQQTSNESNHRSDQEKQELNTLFENARIADKKQSVEISDSETKTAFRKVREKISGQDKTEISKPQTNSAYFKYAAAALIIIGLVGIGFLFTPHTIEVPDGSIRTVDLSDGTTVTLNSGSTLSYVRWFDLWGRTVTLNGEAFFEVPQNGDPFHVETNQARVTVMGTKFNVHSWANDTQQKTSVYLQEGKVSFSSEMDSRQRVILSPGEFSWVSQNQVTPTQPKKTEKSKAVAWMQNSLAFDNQPLTDIFAEISRRFDVKIQTPNREFLDETLTIYLSDIKNVEQVIADICRVKNLDYSKNDRTFIITASS